MPRAWRKASRRSDGSSTVAADSRDWGHIAVAAGYYDQAHLITDFRELTGLTPGAFVRRMDAPRVEASPPA